MPSHLALLVMHTNVGPACYLDEQLHSNSGEYSANNISDMHYWSTIGTGSITGQSTGSYFRHLGEPRLIRASMRHDFNFYTPN